MSVRNRLRSAAIAMLSVSLVFGLQACNRNGSKNDTTSPPPPSNTVAPGTESGSTPGSMNGNTAPPVTPSASGTAAGSGS